MNRIAKGIPILLGVIFALAGTAVLIAVGAGLTTLPNLKPGQQSLLWILWGCPGGLIGVGLLLVGAIIVNRVMR
jgi:hypothetical protein